MSQENLEIVKRGVDAFNSGDLEAMLAVCDQDFEWRPAFGAAMLGGTVYRGHAAFRQYWSDATEIWDQFRFDPESFREDGQTVVVVGRGSGRAKGSGIEIDQPFAMTFRLRDGKLAFGQTFTDPDEALRDAGLSE